MSYPLNYVAALGDVDGDGALDVFAGGFDQGYKVWRNDGTGRFGEDGYGLYWLAGGGVGIIGLGLLWWWVRRRKIEKGEGR